MDLPLKQGTNEEIYFDFASISIGSKRRQLRFQWKMLYEPIVSPAHSQSYRTALTIIPESDPVALQAIVMPFRIRHEPKIRCQNFAQRG